MLKASSVTAQIEEMHSCVSPAALARTRARGMTPRAHTSPYCQTHPELSDQMND